MKLAKITISILAILMLGFTLFEVYTLSKESIVTIHTSLIAVLSAIITLTLLVLRATMVHQQKIDFKALILSGFIIAGTLWMYIDKSRVNNLWNYVLTAFIALAGMGIIQMSSGKHIWAKSARVTTIALVMFSAVLLVLKIESSLLYTIGFYLLALTSLLTLIAIFKGKRKA